MAAQAFPAPGTMARPSGGEDEALAMAREGKAAAAAAPVPRRDSTARPERAAVKATPSPAAAINQSA